jgi:tetratricopeptide (TPR) repeat protein
MQITKLTIEGRAALAEGDGQRALDLLSRKHERLLGVFPEDSGSVGTSLVDLAEALHLVGRQKDARKAVDHALVIFRRLDRRDEMRERLESALIEICRRQGHTFVVEDLLQNRISEGRGPSSDEDLRRAVDQDELAMMFFRQRQYEKALPLLMDSKDVFERAGASAQADLAICYQYIARVYLHTERFDESVAYGRKALACTQRTHGKDSLEATMVSDELAVAVAFCAKRDNDPEKARESIALFRPIFCPRATARARPSPVRARIRSRSNSARPPSTVSIKRPCDVVVSAHVSPSDLKPAFLAVIAASLFNRSRVDRARRSSLVTVSTSPASSTSSKRRSCARSVFAPLATSRKTFLHPALVSCRRSIPSIFLIPWDPACDQLRPRRRRGGSASHPILPECPGLVAQLIGHRMLSSSSFPSGRSRWRRRGH